MALYIGIDGCKEAWIAAILENGKLRIEKHKTIDDIMQAYPHPDVCLIDMAIGLPDRDHKDLRPDRVARRELGKKGSSVFPVPSREAVQVKAAGRDPKEVQAEQKETNRNSLGVSLSQQTLAIIPKIKELDDFLEAHAEYRNVLVESHPEVCFKRLKGEVLYSKKSKKDGREERIKVLRDDGVIDESFDVRKLATDCKCKPDDILDAIVLAVTARMKAQGMCDTLSANKANPSNPPTDARGLRMQMVVPKEKSQSQIIDKETLR